MLVFDSTNKKMAVWSERAIIGSKYTGPNFFMDTQNGKTWMVGQMLSDGEIFTQRLMRKKVKPGKTFKTHTNKYLCNRQTNAPLSELGVLIVAAGEALCQTPTLS